MTQISFHYRKPPQTYIIISVIFISLVKLVLSVNPQFEACTPRSCGNGPTIKYPFWIPGDQDYFCGHPQFEISCDHKNPFLRISNGEILLKAISYSNSSFLATHMAVYEENCPAPMYNFSLDQTPFTYTSDNANISFFYNCATEPVDYPTYEVDCAKNATHYSFAVFHKEALEKNYSLSECQFTFNAPVRVNDAVNFTSLLQMNYTEILKMGFVLSWTASDCGDCEKSGGRCGFDDHKFLCFCRDKTHTRNCEVENHISVKNKAIVGVCASAFTVLVMLIAFFIYHRRKKMSNAKSYARTENISSVPSLSLKDPERGSKYFGLPVFSYDELEEATNYFDSEREIGDGGFGTVYFGKLRDGRYVAVKRLYEKNYRRLEQFKTEVEILARFRHQNLVSLYGCTSRHSRELLLVFGVVLIELISSMPAVDITRHRHEINLSNMAISKIQSRELHELVDPNLGFESDYRIRKEISGVAELAFQCLQSLKDMRPSMEEVLERLKDIQSDGKHKGKAEEMVISADDAVLLKNEPPPASPDSNLRSTSTTTPNDSR
ncbi:hypothetical protein L6164_008037 [Bauhinia variegata]|uniref:Uncharacterized protein n=1 Tax=Bauhinia variegata TaxID=167791 RepID=A0ACB9PF93_BAUVA|nr:hypothetical protein L6164_008037 [Bauhinia variegata]